MPVRFELPIGHPHVAVVTLDRPDRANSLDPVMLRELAAAWTRIAADDAIRAAVLTGAGERVFCSGMDMTTTIPASQRLARGERVSDEEFAGLRSVQTALLAGFDLRTPLIAAVNGHARAGGFDLMLASELRLTVRDEIENGLVISDCNLMCGSSGWAGDPPGCGQRGTKITCNFEDGNCASILGIQIPQLCR